MNGNTENLIDQACSYLPGIERRTYKEAYRWLSSMISQNKLLISSLIMNLDKKSMEQARLLINLATISKMRNQIFSFPLVEGFSCNYMESQQLLFLNGGQSFQSEVGSDVTNYQHIYPNASPHNLHVFPDAGHHLHYTKHDESIMHISKWLEQLNRAWTILKVELKYKATQDQTN